MHVHIGFVVHKVALRQVCVLVVQFSPLSVSFHQRSILIFIYMLFLPEIQTVESLEPSNEAGRWQHWAEKHSTFHNQ
jgi:hypothetical protein